ncbi:acyl-CoA dehydrogenase domain protein [Shewanella halifaxensis HAW-EB4]|uniref:Acyl-CoA dehydrogenase domain protein n=1 Tax=Shewanella halifaxensis (strain HAW-EB4) TaxID=458817 RepID=B0TTV2_SHEHH|nr:acyl-CoA dehydrogenase family protein [Shewanella halifaxensis]ABZ76670.1 acyl-CoA dehydrogenase domain protein [Shewanella halifaxensis HAW-EB4]
MDFSLTEEQQAIFEMSQGVFNDCCTDEYLREVDVSNNTRMDKLWQTCIETGLHALYLPEEFGGSELGMTELALVLQAQGAALGLVPLWRHQLAATCLAKFGAADLHPVINAAATADNLLTLSVPNLTKHNVSVKAAPNKENGYVLNGKLSAVADAATASHVLIPVELDNQVRFALVSLDGINIKRIDGILTHGEQVSDLVFNESVLSGYQLLSTGASEWLTPRVLAAQSAIQLGVSEEQLKRTVEYICERRQFDRQIGSFQAVQMTMADCRIALEVLRSTLFQLCYRIDAGLGCDSEALACALHACDAGHLIGHKAQHVHGGFGVDTSYPIHRYLYWSRAISLGLGGSQAIAERLGDWLAENDKLGWKYDLNENN